MDAYKIMRELDREADIQPRSDGQLDIDVPGSLTARVRDWDWDTFRDALAAAEPDAIIEARQMWGLPIFT